MADDQYSGFQAPASTGADRNAIDFIVRMILSGTATAKMVEVMGVTGGQGALAEGGTVDVKPLVPMVDGKGVAHPHGTIYGLPYLRLQGGHTAIIIDPVVGDLGLAVFLDRDHSSVIANRGPANPGSRREFDLADGVYVTGLLNGIPTRYLRASEADGWELVDPAKITLTAPEVAINASTRLTVTSPHSVLDGDVHITGDLLGDGTAAFDGDVTADGTSVHTHHHGGVTTGGGNTGGPI